MVFLPDGELPPDGFIRGGHSTPNRFAGGSKWRAPGGDTVVIPVGQKPPKGAVRSSGRKYSVKYRWYHNPKTLEQRVLPEGGKVPFGFRRGVLPNSRRGGRKKPCVYAGKWYSSAVECLAAIPVKMYREKIYRDPNFKWA